jgi:hypothetical protein
MLMCLQSQDPQVSLEPVVEGPTEEVPEDAHVSVWETVKLVAERFESQPEDTYVSSLLLVAPILLFCK